MSLPFRTVLAVGYGAMRSIRNSAIALSLSAAVTMAQPVHLVALGDSLTAGYGLTQEDGFVPRLQAWLGAQGADVVVLNAGVSGDTTAGGLARLDWTLTPPVDALIVTLGGNDMLRGIDPASSRANLEAILAESKARGLPVLLVGLLAPNNYGPDFKAAFDAMYPELAAQYGTLLVADFFAPLRAADPDNSGRFMQADGLHPNAAGVEKIVAALGPQVLALLARVPK